MTLAESLHVVVYKYDYTQNEYVAFRTLTDYDIIAASSKRQCCQDGAFEIGGVYSATFSMQARISGMTTFQVRGAKLEVLLSRDGGAYERQGVYWVTDATRVGEVFTLNAQDAVGWLDTSSYNDTANASGVGKVLLDKLKGSVEQGVIKSVGLSIDTYAMNSDEMASNKLYRGWLEYLTDATNSFILSQTGVRDMLQWHWQPPGYDSSKQNTYTQSDVQCLTRWYCNSRIHIYNDGAWTPSAYRAQFYLYGADESTETGTGASDSDTPRDFYRYLSELAFGFIYARQDDGALALGQFGGATNGSVILSRDEIEYGSCEVADYAVETLRILTQVEQDDSGTASCSMVNKNPNYSAATYQRFTINSNPFLDGFYKDFVAESGYSMLTVPHAMWLARYPGSSNGYTVRPFSCRVHSSKTFRLGQCITIPYKAEHEANVTNYSSIITAIEWTYRGGTQLSCGGADSRVMADCLKASKGDKVRKEARNRCRALEKRVKNLGG